MKTTLLFSLAAVSTAFAGTPAPLSPPPAAPSSSEWRFRNAAYLWAQGLDGTAGVKGLAADVDMSFGDIAEDLDFAFMGAFELSRGPWSVLVDLNYAEMSDSASVPGVLLDSGEFKMQQFLSNVYVMRRVYDSGTTTLDLYGGARINWMDLDISIAPIVGPAASRSGDKAWVDAVAGFRLQHSLSEKWFAAVSADIGGGSSDLTWQANALVGYRLTESCNIGAGYRGLGTDYSSGGFTYDVTASGPFLGVEWNF